jgi:hypothetical protein
VKIIQQPAIWIHVPAFGLDLNALKLDGIEPDRDLL